MPIVAPSRLTTLVERIFQAAGASPHQAGIVAHSLVSSDLVGHDSHGVVRIQQYLDSIATGDIDPRAEPEVQHETPVIVLVNGHKSFGQVAAAFTIEKAIEKAHTSGLAAAGLFGGGHIGRLGEWVSTAAEAGMVALAFCNGGGKQGIVTPFGGVARLLGTNPVAAAVPVEGKPPIVVDFATSAVAEGKIRVARNRGQQVPEGLFLRADGQPSTQPDDLYNGGVLLPSAGHKGYGLSLLVECLGGLLTGHGSASLGREFNGGNGVLFILLSIEAFRPFADFTADTALLYERVKAVPTAPGFQEVMLPGEPEARTAAQRAAGITVDDATWAFISGAAERFGITIEELEA